MKNLIYHELKLQNKVYNITKYIFIFFLFCSLATGFINSEEDIQRFGIIFSIISIPLAFIGLSSILIKPDIEDGYLETLLSSTLAIKIILSKYIALSVCSIMSFVLVAPIIYILYNIDNSIFVMMSLAAITLIFLSAALIILIASIQAYFRSNTNFLSIIIMPLIIPSIIISGVLIQNIDQTHLLFIMIGIDCIIIPPALYLSSYLIENIYNI